MVHTGRRRAWGRKAHFWALPFFSPPPLLPSSYLEEAITIHNFKRTSSGRTHSWIGQPPSTFLRHTSSFPFFSPATPPHALLPLLVMWKHNHLGISDENMLYRISKIVRVPVPGEDSVLRVPAGLKEPSPTSPQGTGGGERTKSPTYL